MAKTFNLTLNLIIIILIVSCGKPESQDPQKVSSEFETAANTADKINILERFKETNPDNEILKSMINTITKAKLNEEGIADAADFLFENENIAAPGIFNSLAWQLYESNENLELAAKLAEKGTMIARNELSTASESKPENISAERWQSSKEQNLAMILDTYACIEKKRGNVDSALPLFEEAVDLTQEQYVDINENYVSVIIEKGNYAKAQSLLEKFISERNDSDSMKKMLKDVYVKLNNSEKDFEDYISKFEKIAHGKMVEDLKKQIKEVPAVNFTLFDLKGKKVNLSDYKGQIVILDFWATWCGPCLRSFPGMQKAVEKLSKEENVKFLFVNTRERVEDKKENARKFIEKNSYPFHVLLDDQNEVYKAYGVRGIPTKFIIDKNQNIRFESIGFAGNTDELVEELSIMVSMLK